MINQFLLYIGFFIAGYLVCQINGYGDSWLQIDPIVYLIADLFFICVLFIAQILYNDDLADKIFEWVFK